MPGKVADASVLAAMVFGEPRADEAGALLAGNTLYEPTLLRFELTNVACQKVRQNPDRTSLVSEGLIRALGLPIEWVEVGASELMVLALETGLSAYDASYLLVARQTKSQLVTFDERLRAAFRPGRR